MKNLINKMFNQLKTREKMGNNPNFQRHFDRGAERATQVATEQVASQTATVVERAESVAEKSTLSKVGEKLTSKKALKWGGIAVGVAAAGYGIYRGVKWALGKKKSKKKTEKPAEETAGKK